MVFNKSNFSQNQDGDDLDFNFGKPASFKDIVFIHLKRIAQISACEYRGGYSLLVTDKKGTEREIYVEDSRERYSNAVLMLAHLLLPKFDKKMKEKFKEFENELKEMKDKFLEDSSIDETEILGEGFYEDIKDKTLLEEYKIKKLQKYHGLFSQLSLLLARKNYMEIGGLTF